MISLKVFIKTEHPNFDTTIQEKDVKINSKIAARLKIDLKEPILRKKISANTTFFVVE